MKKAFITGITGQDGSYLAELLLGKGYDVHGLIRRSSSFNTGRIDHVYDEPHDQGRRLHLHYGDLTDGSNLASLIGEIEPDEVYNLGAQSHVQVSFSNPLYTADVDAVGTLRLLEAIRMTKLPIRFYQASSSEMFGAVLETPQSETTPFNPRSPYGCGKVYSYWQTRNYRDSYGMFACNGILFNHESPAPRQDVCDAKDHARRSPNQARSSGQAVSGEPRRQTRLGVCRRLRRGDVAACCRSDEAATTMSIATGESVLGARVRRAGPSFKLLDLDPDEYVRDRPAPTSVPPRSRRAPRRREQGSPGKSSNWQAAGVSFEELVRMMVDADLQEAERERATGGRPDSRSSRTTSRSGSLMSGSQSGAGKTSRVVITGGAGFVGQHRLQMQAAGERGAQHVFDAAPIFRLTTSRPSDGVRLALSEDAVPDVVIHLPRPRSAASAPTWRTPVDYFFANMAMGLQPDRIRVGSSGLEQVRADRHRSAPTPSTRLCRFARRTCGTVTRRKPTHPTESPRRLLW